VVRAALQRLEPEDGVAEKQPDPASLTGPGSDGDIAALAFTVMMEAARSADEDLKTIMAEVKAMNSAKARLRDLINLVNRDVAANGGCGDAGQKLDFSRGLGSEQAYHRAPWPVLDPDASGGVRLARCDLHRGKIDSFGDLQGILDDLKGKLDSMSEMSEMTSLRLQMAMDRRSKLMESLSNIMKKISTTNDALVQNLK
jgi:hypothetical protein